MLRLENVTVQYGAITAVRGVSLNVPVGAIVTLIGANGAGKTTTLRAISGVTRIASGSITFGGAPITNEPPHRIVARGLSHVPEGRMIFPELTVNENLDMGAYLRRDRAEIARDRADVFAMFPRLEERQKQPGGTLSGGEQQMLAIARALMGRPRMLLLDEPSLGIAPKLVKTIFERITQINAELGVTILLVEQNAHLALSIAHYAYVFETGQITLHGPAADLAKNEDVRRAYLGG